MRISDWSSDVCSSDLVEALGQLHQAQRLAVALRARHAEVALALGLGVAALPVADHHPRAPVDPCQAADARGVVGVGALAGQFLAPAADHPQLIQGGGTGGCVRERSYKKLIEKVS